MKRLTLAACLALSALTLAACGNTTGDRALSGGGIGAGVGALGGLMVGAPPDDVRRTQAFGQKP
jgi:osmotically inducible lipoprotein OsmB